MTGLFLCGFPTLTSKGNDPMTCQMTYQEFRKYMLSYGFLDCVLTEAQYAICVRDGLDLDGIYGVACDVECGIKFSRALAIEIDRSLAA